jgi:2-succinyl-5-enolpyruvyl-6-hydroxy-3-cyclohexene-1-carboxylate synthase
VINDDGGGIFGLLEQGAPEFTATFDRVFGTPHGVDVADLCAATRTQYERADLESLPAVLKPRPGLRVVEITVSRTAHRELHGRVRAAVADALSR